MPLFTRLNWSGEQESFFEGIFKMLKGIVAGSEGYLFYGKLGLSEEITRDSKPYGV